jgi:EAL domain-containing protein (putative c-di-GMP-specific phosphodiesterase class I)
VVTLSDRNLLDEHLPGRVAELLAEHRVAAAFLVLEVTECAVVTEPARACRLLDQLRSRASASPSTISARVTPAWVSSRRCR